VKLRVALNKKKGENKLFAVADVTVFKFTQEANERLHTGSRVLITGDGFPDFYEQKDGTVVAKLDVVADAWKTSVPAKATPGPRPGPHPAPAATAAERRLRPASRSER